MHSVRLALRRLRRSPGFTLLTASGLALGLACALLIGSYLAGEWRYDSHYVDSDRLVRVATVFGDEVVTVSASAVAPVLIADVPTVTHAVRMFDATAFATPFFAVEGDGYEEAEGVWFADEGWADVIGTPLVAGTARLVDPATVLLSERTAERYFGSTQAAVGQTITMDARRVLTVTGVFADAPETSHIRPRIVASWYGMSRIEPSWQRVNYVTYARLTDRAELASAQATLNQIGSAVADDERNFDRMVLQPVDAIHATESGSNLRYLMLVVLVLVLVIAAVNFVNLTTARQAERTGEVGVRKAVGAPRSVLVWQFLGESLAITSVAGVVGVGLTALGLPFAEAIAGRDVMPPSDVRWLVGLAYIGATVGVGLLAGIYPALALSGGSSLQALRGRVIGRQGGMQLRRVLVTAQFAISLAFVAGALIVQQQLDFLRTADLGFDRAATVAVPLGGWDGQTFARVRAELGDIPGVLGIASMSSLPGGRHGGYSATWPGREGDDLMLRASVASADAVDALGLRIVAGTALPAVAAADSVGAFRFVVNEEVARIVAGSNEAAIGHPFLMNGREGEIAGVVEDFHYASLHEAVGPFALFSEAQPYYSTLVVRLAPDAPGDVLDQLAARWNASETGRPFVYHFMDEQLGALYAADRRLGSLVGLAALVTILVACLGLFGLAAFSVARRRKEIGVRKALGAAAVGIVGLVSREFAVLVGLGFAIGAPVAWAFGAWWKEGFAYSATGAGWAIATSGILVLALALLTVSYHAWRAATLDPALVLRDE